MDIIAAELGLDPADVRMKNFIQPEDQPFNTSAGRLYDSGDYPDTLAKLLEVSEYEKMRAAQAEARERGELAGIGICCFVEHSSTGSQDYHKRGVYGLPAFDSATVKVDAGGNIMVAVSAKSTGQSHDSVFALLVARELGVPYETVKILEGDTDAVPFGSGTGVSRSAVSTGGAIRLAVRDVKNKATEIARFFMEGEAGELEISEGQIYATGDPSRSVAFAAVAAAAHDASRIVSLPESIERGLQATRTFDPPHQTFGHGAHMAFVRVDRETGIVKVEDYVCVEDCGTIIDHVIVDGQVVGAVGLGIGNALHEGTGVRRRRPIADRHVHGLPGADCPGHTGHPHHAHRDAFTVHGRRGEGRRGGGDRWGIHRRGERGGRCVAAAGSGGDTSTGGAAASVGADQERASLESRPGQEIVMVSSSAITESGGFRYIGKPIRRKEDRRFLTGRGQFVDDVKLPNALHAAILRSPHAHAHIVSIDTAPAREMPGVVDVLTFQDIAAMVEPRPIPVRLRAYSDLLRFLQYPLAHGKVRYVGDPVAIVLAESRYLAEDAVEAMKVEYKPMPALVDVKESVKGETLIHEAQGTNIAFEFSSSIGDPDAAFRDAEYVRKEEFRCHRHTANPMETRGLAASYDAGREQLTVWGETKVPHYNRGVLSSLLQMPEHRIHFVEPDVGGGFGVRGEFYPENFLVPFAAIKTGRPVKWTEDRGRASNRGQPLAGARLRTGGRSAKGRHDTRDAGTRTGCAGRVRPDPRGVGADLNDSADDRSIQHPQLRVGREVRADQQSGNGDVQRTGAV